MVLLGLSCGGSDTPTEPDPSQDDPLPDFTLRDENLNSGTYQDSVSFSDFDGRIVLIYFVYAPCAGCRRQLSGLSEVVDSLHSAFSSGAISDSVVGFGINHPAAKGDISMIWTEMYTNLPVLQDVLTMIGGSQVPAVAALLECGDYSDYFLIVDRERRCVKKTRSCELQSKCGLNLSSPAGRAQVIDWASELDSTGAITVP